MLLSIAVATCNPRLRIFCVARHRCGQCRGHDTRCNFASRWQRNKKTKTALRAREKTAACTHSFNRLCDFYRFQSNKLQNEKQPKTR